MNEPYNNDKTDEEELADFADQVLSENAEADQDPSAPDPEMRALQQTVLRLKKALPEDGPSDAAVFRMRQNIVRQWKQQENQPSSSWKRSLSLHKLFGLRWESQDRRRRKTMVVYLGTALLLLLVSFPFLYDEPSLQPAASGHHWNASIFFAVSGLILLGLWFFRRKR